MKKEDWASLIVYAIIIVSAILVFLYVVSPIYVANGAEGAMGFAYSLGGFLVTLIIGGLLTEIGHVLGAKIGKYQIISVNFLWLNLYKKDNKFKFRFKSFDGLMGDTIVMPKKDENDKFISKPKAMLWLPIIFLILLLIGSFFLYSLTEGIWQAVGVVSLFVSAMLLFYDIVPTQLDSLTDGYQLTIVMKKENIEAFNESLRVRSCNILGQDPGDTKVFDDVTDYTYDINLVKVYKYLLENKQDEAYKILDKMCQNTEKLSEKNKAKLFAQKTYLLIINDKLTEAKEFYYEKLSQEERKNISNLGVIECIRAYVLVAGILENSEGEVQYTTSRANAAYKKVESGRKEIEKTLYKNALVKVREKHPTWQLVLKDVKKDKKADNQSATSTKAKTNNKTSKVDDDDDEDDD